MFTHCVAKSRNSRLEQFQSCPNALDCQTLQDAENRPLEVMCYAVRFIPYEVRVIYT